MKPFLSVTAAAVTAALAACASPADAPAAPAHTASIANSCINPTQIAEQKIVSDTEIRFTMKNKDVWVNTLPHQCFNLNFEQGFSWEVHGTLVCSNEERIVVRNSGTPCQLGVFKRIPASPT